MSSPSPPLRRALPRLASTLVALVALGAGLPAGAAAETTVLTFPADADAYVDASQPSHATGSSSSLRVDADPPQQSFLRFWALGLAGRPVTGARLRLTQTDASRSGGGVHAVGSTAWPESIGWESRPALGTLLGSFGAVSNGTSYALPLPAGSVGEGLVSLGMDSQSTDGARWGSSESAVPPRLEVEVDTPPGFVADGLSLLAGPEAGSSDPTFHPSNRRVAVTARGRTLAVFGRHASGVQLAWRDPAGGWETRSTGGASDGTLLGGTGTGDWAASIAVARDAAGAESAWVVWSGLSSSALRPVQMRRITELDAPAGPRLGPVVTVDEPAQGAFRPDVAMEALPDGSSRGWLVWSRRTSDTEYEIASGAFDATGSDAPAIRRPPAVYRSTSSSRFGTLAATKGGMRVLARASSGALTLYARPAGDTASGWTRGAVGPVVPSGASPSATALPTGEILVALERDVTAHVTGVYRFSASGGAVVREADLEGYAQPTLAVGAGRATVVGVRPTLGHLVSRERGAGGEWTVTDRLEVGPEGRAPLKFPNALREADGRLRLIAEGADGSSVRSGVLAYQRPF